MAAVRQHYKLATTGKLGQQADVKTGTKSTAKTGSSYKSNNKGSGSKKSRY